MQWLNLASYLKKTFTLSITSYTLGQTITSKLRCHGRSCILQWMFHLIWESMVLAAAGIAAAWSRATTRLPRSTGTRRSSPTCCGSPAGKLTSKLSHGADANRWLIQIFRSNFLSNKILLGLSPIFAISFIDLAFSQSRQQFQKS